MILSNTFEVKMEMSVRIVVSLHAAQTDTFLMLVVLNSGKDAVLHIDSRGKLLFQHEFPEQMLTMSMISPR